ncbi:Homocysteine S-methyltransferase [Cadophora sp. MPI-SDFR-AT-0126]|nr:Homocysteine S-methyltransferase [Leotiomycetes sp. MPI-SDFR-AT-0126]
MPPPRQAPQIQLLDGGLGTTLADQHSCTFDASTPLWSSHLLVTDPDTLRKVQTAFVDAGADVLLSATYQVSFEGFAGTGDGIGEKRAAELMRSAVGIARGAFAASGTRNEEDGKEKGKVALSLGAYGATMIPSQEYSGKYDEARLSVSGLKGWHLKRLSAFAPISGIGAVRENSLDEEKRSRCWKDVDLVAFETLPLLEEITAVRQVMYELEVSRVGKREFWISCVFPGEGMGLPDGSLVEDVVRAMLERREGEIVPMGIGINCTKVGKLEGLVLEFERVVGEVVQRGAAEWPKLVIYPDGTDGEVYDTVTKEWVKSVDGGKSEISWDETVFGIMDRARKRGLWKGILVGGCCKTTPDDISKLRRRIDEVL